MRRYRFEIVRRAFGRFGWIVVDERRGRRVLARSQRSWRTKKKVRKAIYALGGAPVVDATNDHGRFQLPATSFQLLPDALPLIVQEGSGARRGRARRAR